MLSEKFKGKFLDFLKKEVSAGNIRFYGSIDYLNDNTFRYKDNNDNGKTKFMTLDVLEFIRRFLLHILPKGFMKIRYYGLMGSRNRNTKLLLCKRLTQTDIVEYIRLSTDQLIEKLGLDINKCPVCGCKKFVKKEPVTKSIPPPPVKKYQFNNY